MPSSIPRPGLDTYFLFPAVSPTLGLLGVGVGQCTSTCPSHIQPRTYVSIATLSPKISWEFRTAATGGAGQTAPPVGWPWVWGKGPGSQMQLEAGPQPHSRGSDHPGCFSSLLTGPYPPGSPLQKQGSLSPIGSPCSQPLGSPLPQDEVSPLPHSDSPVLPGTPHPTSLLLQAWPSPGELVPFQRMRRLPRERLPDTTPLPYCSQMALWTSRGYLAVFRDISGCHTMGCYWHLASRG